MRVIRWRKADTGVESLTITANGVYFPVGKTDSGFKLKLSMASGGQSASVDIVRSTNGDRAGYSAVSVSGTTESKVAATLSLSYGIVVSGISGTLNAILDDETPVTVFPDAGGGRFPAKEDVDAYYYGASVPAGFQATAAGVSYSYGAGGWANIVMFPNFASLPSFANDGDIAYIPQLVGSETIRMRWVSGIGWVVEPGQAVINAYNQFEVVSAPSTAAIIFAFPWAIGLFLPNQTWRMDIMASGVIGATAAGFRTTFGGTGANSAKTTLNNSTIPRTRSNKSFSIKPNGNLDFFEFDGGNYAATYDSPMSEGGLPRILFEPSQVGDSFLLRSYILRRIG